MRFLGPKRQGGRFETTEKVDFSRKYGIIGALKRSEDDASRE